MVSGPAGEIDGDGCSRFGASVQLSGCGVSEERKQEFDIDRSFCRD